MIKEKYFITATHNRMCSVVFLLRVKSIEHYNNTTRTKLTQMCNSMQQDINLINT